MVDISQFASFMTVLTTTFKYLFYAYLLSTYKSLPGAYYIRFWFYVIRNLFVPAVTGKNTNNIKTLQNDKYGVFRHTTLSTYCSWFEIDGYFHKSNSTYFEELDIARTDLMTKVFQKLFLTSKRYPYLPVAETSSCFFKDIAPLQKYQIQSNVLCWDKKWLYILSKFTVNNGSTLVSLALTRYVFKDGRRTMKPADVLEICGLYNEEVEKISAENFLSMGEHNGFENIQKLLELNGNYGKL